MISPGSTSPVMPQDIRPSAQESGLSAWFMKAFASSYFCHLKGRAAGRMFTFQVLSNGNGFLSA